MSPSSNACLPTCTELLYTVSHMQLSRALRCQTGRDLAGLVSFIIPAAAQDLIMFLSMLFDVVDDFVDDLVEFVIPGIRLFNGHGGGHMRSEIP